MDLWLRGSLRYENLKLQAGVLDAEGRGAPSAGHQPRRVPTQLLAVSGPRTPSLLPWLPWLVHPVPEGLALLWALPCSDSGTTSDLSDLGFSPRG